MSTHPYKNLRLKLHLLGEKGIKCYPWPSPLAPLPEGEGKQNASPLAPLPEGEGEQNAPLEGGKNTLVLYLRRMGRVGVRVFLGLGVWLWSMSAAYAQDPSLVYLPMLLAPTEETTPIPRDMTTFTYDQGFDTCAAPKAADLAMWWEYSPYSYLGIYLGGINHYPTCKRYNEQYQTPAWLSEVAQQGWQFIPIWVGPQAPCTDYNNTFPQDLFQAYQMGLSEARLAIAAATRLGLVSLAEEKTIIYYDLEYYEPVGACHDASKAFLVGWMTELKNNGHKSGIYSIARMVDDWYKLPVTPDSTWAAWYVGKHYVPTMTVQTVNNRWISEPNWDKSRLFQYSGSHDELWGGVIMNIDNNAAAGWVATTSTPMEPLREFKSFTPENRFNGGGNISPIEAAFSLNDHHRWVIDGELILWQTTNAGQHWTRHDLPYPHVPIANVYLGWLDSQVGWVVLQEATNVNTSRGWLLKTEDGGVNWQTWKLPLGEPVEFINAQVGWVRGGPLGTERYLTVDGGRSWLERP